MLARYRQQAAPAPHGFGEEVSVRKGDLPPAPRRDSRASAALPLLLVLFSILHLASCSPAVDAGRPLAGTTLAGNRIELLEGVAKAVVLIFIASDCPISNRYVPEINRIHAEYAERGVSIFLVYTDASFSSYDFQEHRREFALRPPALLDLEQELRVRTGVEVTPEVAVYAAGGDLLYRGRIDNRFVTFGRFRPQATHHDLRLALDAILAGQAVAEPTTQAIGCFIPPLETA